MPLAVAMPSETSFTPGRNADTCGAPACRGNIERRCKGDPHVFSLQDRKRSDVPAGTDIGVADAILSPIKQDTAGGTVPTQENVMLVARKAECTAIEPRKQFPMCRRIRDVYGAKALVERPILQAPCFQP